MTLVDSQSEGVPERERSAGVLREAAALTARGNSAAAVRRIEAGLRAEPGSIPLRTMLADVFFASGDYAAALSAYEQVLDDDPENLRCLQGLSRCVLLRPGLATRLASSAHLRASLVTDGVDPDAAAQGVFVRLRQSPDPVAEPVLPDVLSNALVTDPALEARLTGLRRDLCLAPPAAPPELAPALAAQGRINEYAWSVGTDELEAMARAPEWVRALYGPAADGSAADDADGRRSAADVPSLTPVSAGTSEAVRALYEEHPYPRWQRITRVEPMRLGQALGRLSAGALDAGSVPEHPSMLVAGCGTGRELLIAATAWQPASVTAFDLSRTSLDHAREMADQLGVEVEFHQADLLELGAGPVEWERRFDVIVCTGVLHHLADPVDGWRTLRRLLNPGGVMLIGLYSETARAGITVAQQEVRTCGWPPTLEGIRAAREQLRALPAGHPARDAMLLRDFYSTGGCRDLLFHVQERHFTIGGIREALAELGLEFIAFDVPPHVRARYRALFGRRQDLDCWETFEDLHPQTFLGMYQFWCRGSATG